MEKNPELKQAGMMMFFSAPSPLVDWNAGSSRNRTSSSGSCAEVCWRTGAEKLHQCFQTQRHFTKYTWLLACWCYSCHIKKHRDHAVHTQKLN